MMPLDLLTRQFGLADAQVGPLPFTGGAIKSVYRVESGGKAYVFKRYRPDFRSAADVAAILDAQAFLAKAGVPVAPAVPDREGRVVSPGEDCCWTLHEWVEGRHPLPGRMTGREAAVWGELLGRIDLLLTGWQPDWDGAEVLEVRPVSERVDLYTRLIHQAERGRTDRDEACLQTLRQNLAGIEAMAGVVPRLLAMERQWVHGDPNEGNVLFAHAEDRVVAVLDFDNIRQAPRGFDFMYALNSHFPEACPERDEFARAYFRAVKPTAAELELYAPLWAYRELCDIWPIDTFYLQPDGFDAAWRIPGPTYWYRQHMDATTEWLLRSSI